MSLILSEQRLQYVTQQESSIRVTCMGCERKIDFGDFSFLIVDVPSACSEGFLCGNTEVQDFWWHRGRTGCTVVPVAGVIGVPRKPLEDSKLPERRGIAI
ncbi:hypothetical protein BJF79_01045 [Actinomadura sp. CNU-125]|nr:hypothetical protein BJF79_01045 [Actinomadura sp. CNU-125]